MKILIPSRPLTTEEQCKRCNDKTLHHIELLYVVFATHKVQFMYYCKKCSDDLGDEVTVYLVTISISDWNSLIPNNSTNDN